MVHFPNAHSGLGWARKKPIARNSIYISHVDFKNPIVEPSLLSHTGSTLAVSCGQDVEPLNSSTPTCGMGILTTRPSERFKYYQAAVQDQAPGRVSKRCWTTLNSEVPAVVVPK